MSRVVEQKKGNESNLWVKLTDDIDEKVATDLGFAIMQVEGRGRSKPFKAVGPYGSGMKALIKATNVSTKISWQARKLREAADKARAAEKKKK